MIVENCLLDRCGCGYADKNCKTCGFDKEEAKRRKKLKLQQMEDGTLCFVIDRRRRNETQR